MPVYYYFILLYCIAKVPYHTRPSLLARFHLPGQLIDADLLSDEEGVHMFGFLVEALYLHVSTIGSAHHEPGRRVDATPVYSTRGVYPYFPTE